MVIPLIWFPKIIKYQLFSWYSDQQLNIPPKTSSGSYPSGSFFIAEGYYDVTFTPYVENGYQDYLAGCEPAQDKRFEWTFYNVHITDECSDIVIGHGGSLR